MSDAVLTIEGLSVEFAIGGGFGDRILRREGRAVRAVSNVNLVVGAGEMVALVGESGCGKTTMALAALGLVRPTAGRIVVVGRDVSGGVPRDLRRDMQVVFQDPYEALDPRHTVRRALFEPLEVHGIGGDRVAAARAALARVGLPADDAFLNRYPHELSGGQRQRVAIAAALSLEPKLLIADEPVSMLDVSVRAGVLELLAGLRRDGLGILMITHDLSTAAQHADRLAVMYLGRIVEEGPAREVVRDPRHPYTEALVAAAPRPRHRTGVRRVPLGGEAPDAAAVPSGCRFHPRCPVALDRCATDDPAETVSGNRRVACHLVSGEGPAAAS